MRRIDSTEREGLGSDSLESPIDLGNFQFPIDARDFEKVDILIQSINFKADFT